jgi:hypothetical protein
MLKQLVQLVGAKNPEALGVDFKTALQRFGIPMLSPEEQLREQQRLLQAQTQPAAVAPRPGVAGIQQEPGTSTGFSYVQHPEVIQLSETDDFIASLPSSTHFADERTRKLAARLHRLYRNDFRDRVKDLATRIEDDEFKIELGDSDLIDVDAESLNVLLAAEDEEGVSTGAKAAAAVVSATAAKRIAKRIVDGWTWPQEKLSQLAGATANALQRIFSVALGEVADTTGLSKRPDKDATKAWSFERAEFLASQTDKSLRDELRTFIANALQEGHTDPKDLAREMRSHFSDRPASKSGTVAVTETVGAWNRATLEVARANDVKQVQAIDAQKGPTDEECEERDGKLFPIKAALREDEKERHPNCTLEWRVLQPEVELSLRFSDEMDPNQMAYYDQAEGVIWFSEDSSRPERKRYMEALCRSLEAAA